MLVVYHINLISMGSHARIWVTGHVANENKPGRITLINMQYLFSSACLVLPYCDITGRPHPFLDWLVYVTLHEEMQFNTCHTQPTQGKGDLHNEYTVNKQFTG